MCANTQMHAYIDAAAARAHTHTHMQLQSLPLQEAPETHSPAPLSGPRPPCNNQQLCVPACLLQFGEALRRIAIVKYARISSPSAAWRMLVERHILPVAEACATKYDEYLRSLLAPGTMALLLAWEPHLKQVRQQQGKFVSMAGQVVGMDWWMWQTMLLV